MRLVAMQKNRNGGNGDVGQPQRDRNITPKRQIKNT
jgi:hypothetical protein